jgi:hypothetical protein
MNVKEYELLDKRFFKLFDLQLERTKEYINSHFIENRHLRKNVYLNSLHNLLIRMRDDLGRKQFKGKKSILYVGILRDICKQFIELLENQNGKYFESLSMKFDLGKIDENIENYIRQGDETPGRVYNFKGHRRSILTISIRIEQQILKRRTIDRFLDIIAEYVALDKFINDVQIELKKYDEPGLIKSNGLLDKFLEVEVPKIQTDNLGLNDHLMLIMLLEESNLIKTLRNRTEKHSVLTKIIPTKGLKNVNSAIDNYYNTKYLHDYLKKANNFGRKQILAEKLRNIADRLEEIGN